MSLALDNGTWVEFTTSWDSNVTHTGVIVDSDEDGVTYTVQKYEGNKPVPAPSHYVCHALMIHKLLNKPPLRVLPERKAAIEAEAKMHEAAKRS